MATVNLRAPTEVTARFVGPIITKTSSPLALLNPVNSGQIYRINKFTLYGLTGLEPGYFVGFNGFPGGILVSLVKNGVRLGQLGTFLTYGSSSVVTDSGNYDSPPGFITFYLEEGVGIEVAFDSSADSTASLAAHINYEVIGAPTT
jgi:hypothetical protein